MNILDDLYLPNISLGKMFDAADTKSGVLISAQILVVMWHFYLEVVVLRILFLHILSNRIGVDFILFAYAKGKWCIVAMHRNKMFNHGVCEYFFFSIVSCVPFH